MTIPTEPIGSIPRPRYLQEAMTAFSKSEIPQQELAKLIDKALDETIRLFEASGSPVITDGEQSKPSFATYPIHGLTTLAPDGVVIPFADGHTRQLPKLTAGPFRYQSYASSYLQKARSLTHKQTVLQAIKDNARPLQRVFIGVTNVLDPRVETPEEVRDMILEAAEVLPLSQLGTTDDCGFSPFADDTSTSRETAFAKIKARLEGTRLAEKQLNKSQATAT